MKTLFASVLGFGLMASGAMAEPAKSTTTTPTARPGPVVLTAVQMDEVKAGQKPRISTGNGVNIGVNVSDCGVVVGYCPNNQ